MYHGNATFSNSILLSSAQSWLSDHMITADVSKPHSSLIKVNLTSNGTSDSVAPTIKGAIFDPIAISNLLYYWISHAKIWIRIPK